MNEGKELILPNFLIVGFMKAGTTSLASHLSEHPDIFKQEVNSIFLVMKKTDSRVVFTVFQRVEW